MLDNAVVEAFFKTIKSELIWPVAWQTRGQAENAVARYTDRFYNPVRCGKWLCFVDLNFQEYACLVSMPLSTV